MIAAFTPGWWIAYGLYAALIAGVAAERLTELVISARNRRWALERGGYERGSGHFPVMAALHSALGLGCLAEPLLAGRPFMPGLGVPMVVLALACQALRYWCIGSLGRRWNTRIVVVPGLPLVRRGPYRFLPHPNYVVVAVEGIALPLVFSAWVTAIAFSVLNAVLLLAVRIPAEERALAQAAPVEVPM